MKRAREKLNTLSFTRGIFVDVCTWISGDLYMLQFLIICPVFLHLNAGARCFIRKSLPEDSTELELESKPGFHTRARSCYRWDSKWILWPVLPSMLEMQRECTQDRKEPRTLPAVLMGLSALPISLCRWLYWLLCPITLLLSTSYLENNSIIRLSINRHESQNVKPRWKIAKNKYLTLNVDPRLLFDPSLV